MAAAFAAVPLPVDLFNKLGLVLTTDTTAGTAPIIRTLVFQYVGVNPAITAAILTGSEGAPVSALTLLTAGTLLAEPPILSFVTNPGDPAPTRPAMARCTLDVHALAIVDSGANYSGTITATPVGGLGPGGVAAVLTATQAGGHINSVGVTSGGSGYVGMPIIVIAGSTGGSGAIIIPSMEINALQLLDGGVGYVNAPAVVATPGYQYRFPVNTQGSLVGLLTNYFQTQLGSKIFAQAPTFA